MSRDGQALFGFVRFWSRRWAGADPQTGRDVMVLEAIHARTAAGRAVSVNDVARELGLDQSGASRMVTHAVEAGLVARTAPRRIGAPATVAATAAGKRLLRQAHAWQDQVMRRLTAGWSDEEVGTLMTLMDRLVRAQTDLDAADVE